MNRPQDSGKGNPRERFRTILSADREDQDPGERRKPAIVNLPRAQRTGPEEGEGALPRDTPGAEREAAARKSAWLPRLWTAGAVLSFVANLMLLSMLFRSGTGLRALGPAADQVALAGVYIGLEQLAGARVRTTLPIQTTATVNTSLPGESSTNITLTQDVLMQGAHVTINTALFNIDAPANITLPAGTKLDVKLDPALPEGASLPLSMEVPLDVAVADTDLAAVIRDMQDALRPAVCQTSPGALLPDGTPICR